MTAKLSPHFQNRKPSSIRLAQIEYAKRHDGAKAINLAIGNINLPMHSAMVDKMLKLQLTDLNNGIVKYAPTAGLESAQQTFLHLIKTSGFNADGLYCQVTDGGSSAMELAILGTCSQDRPLMLIEPVYANYAQFAKRLGIPTISIVRELNSKGEFELPDVKQIEKIIAKNKPGALIVIPYDNPTGQLYKTEMLLELARLCVEYDIWMISDEAYRELYYEGEKVSVWGLNNEDVVGIEGRRISIETTSKVFNACGLRIGGLVTDNVEFYEKSTAEYTANLSANTIGQVIFSALLEEPKEKLQTWYQNQREYYSELLDEIYIGLRKLEPELIVSHPQSALYSVIDVRNLVDENFSAEEFVLWSAREGSVEIDGQSLTLLLAPMSGFYNQTNQNLARTQMRLAVVENLDKIKLVPELLVKLLEKYKNE